MPFPYNEERQRLLFGNAGGPTPPPVPMTSCSPPEVAAQTGRFCVVMRGEDGRLLGSFALYEGVSSRAFGFVPVTPESEDYWLRAVNPAAYNKAAAAGPSILHLRSGSHPALVEAALRRAGATARFGPASVIRMTRRDDRVGRISAP